MKKKCVITFYDPTIKSPPFNRIKLESLEINQPEIDHIGEKFASILDSVCSRKGYDFKFYSCGSDDFSKYDYEIVVEKPSNLPEKIKRRLKMKQIEKGKEQFTFNRY